jgi:hypothetical protein
VDGVAADWLSSSLPLLTRGSTSTPTTALATGAAAVTSAAVAAGTG